MTSLGTPGKILVHTQINKAEHQNPKVYAHLANSVFSSIIIMQTSRKLINVLEMAWNIQIYQYFIQLHRALFTRTIAHDSGPPLLLKLILQDYQNI